MTHHPRLGIVRALADAVISPNRGCAFSILIWKSSALQTNGWESTRELTMMLVASGDLMMRPWSYTLFIATASSINLSM